MNCCRSTPNGLDKVFDRRMAQREARAYLKKGLDQPGRTVADVLKTRGVGGASVLEIGAGAGGLHLDLLKAGASRAADLDLSPAYLEAARQNAEKLGLQDSVEHRLHNIADRPEDVAEADVVVLNRVICCYPDLERLLRPAAERARRLLALTFPREAWWMLLGVRLMNAWLGLTRNDFRVYVHPPRAIFDVVAASGLAPVHQSFSGPWQIVVFQRSA